MARGLSKVMQLVGDSLGLEHYCSPDLGLCSFSLTSEPLNQRYLQAR